MKKVTRTEKRLDIVLDNFNSMLDECKSQGIDMIILEVGDNAYAHPVTKKLKLKGVRHGKTKS